MNISWGVIFFTTVILLQIILLFCLCTGRITIFTFIGHRRTINNNERNNNERNNNEGNNMNRNVIVNQVIKQNPIKEIEINPPHVFIIKHPNNEISVGIKHEIT